MLPACFLRASFNTATAEGGLTSTFPSKLNWTETHTIWSTFLGSTQEAHMGATCVLPSVASLTGRAVCKHYRKCYCHRKSCTLLRVRVSGLMTSVIYRCTHFDRLCNKEEKKNGVHVSREPKNASR